MDTKHDDGGPAFPFVRYYEAGVEYSDGMKLWDFYAAAALQGELASQSESGSTMWSPKHAHVLAEMCAAYADAMIAERRKRGIGQ